MKKILFILMLIMFLSCSKETNQPIVQQVEKTIIGTISLNGQPLSDIDISIYVDSDTIISKTDVNGMFILSY